MKVCSRQGCSHGGKPQPLEAFCVDRYSRDGRDSSCKDCGRARGRATRARQREEFRAARTAGEAPAEVAPRAPAMAPEAFLSAAGISPATLEALRGGAPHNPAQAVTAPFSVATEERPQPKVASRPNRQQPQEGVANLDGPFGVALLFDIHRSAVNGPFWQAILFWLRDVRPEVVILGGDVEDWEGFSRHVPDHLAANGADAFSYYRLCLREVREASGGRVVVLEGNHEEWVANYMNKDAATARLIGLVQTVEEVTHEEGCDYIRRDAQPFQVGELDAYHGHQLFAGRFAPTHHAAKVAQVYGRPGRTAVYGHVHVRQDFTLPGLGGNRRARAFGCARSIQPQWRKGVLTGWVPEIGWAFVEGSGATHLQGLEFVSGGLAWGRKVYRGDREKYAALFGHLESAA